MELSVSDKSREGMISIIMYTIDMLKKKKNILMLLVQLR